MEEAEVALRASESRLSAIITSLPIVLFAVNREGIFTLSEGKGLEALGLRPGQVVGQSVFEVYRDNAVILYNIQRALEGHTFEDIVEVGELTFESRYVPIRDAGGEVDSVIGIAIDVSARRQIEKALAHERDLLHALMDNIPDMIYFKDPEGRFTRINRAQAEVLGVSAEEAIGKTDFDFFTPEHASAAHADELEIVCTGQPVVGKIERIRRADGRFRMVSATKVPITDEAGRVLGLVGISRDIDDLIRAEETLRRYAHRLTILREIDHAILAAQSPQAIASAALHHLPELAPLTWANVLAFDFVAATSTLLACYPEKDAAMGDSPIPPVPGAQPAPQPETDSPAADDRPYETPGSHFPLALIDDLVERLQSGEVYTEDNLTALPLRSEALGLSEDDPNVRSFASVPLIAQGELLGCLNLMADTPEAFTPEHLEVAREVADQLSIAIQQAHLHEQVQRHADDLERRVAERTEELQVAAGHLEALSRVKDEFVSNVSHELRTPIASLKVHHRLLAENPQKRDAYLATLQRETERLEHIVEDLLLLSRLDQNRAAMIPGPVDLNELAEQYVTDRRPLAEKRGLTLAFRPGANIPTVQADWTLLGQALSALLTNALNFTPSGGQVTVSTCMHTSEGRREAGVCVSDTGLGIPPDEATRIFDRFYRGRVAHISGTAGTGLGLPIVKEIMRQHRGRIEVESTGVPGQGAAFTLWLPTEGEA